MRTAFLLSLVIVAAGCARAAISARPSPAPGMNQQPSLGGVVRAHWQDVSARIDRIFEPR